MIDKIKVSAIIPFYNGVEWLCDAVQSVLDQTHKNIEIIVVNDGSPEDVSGFLERYGEHIKYYYKENGGAASARNLAISKATGDYFALLDSDDIWLPQKTELQLQFMERNNLMWSHTAFYYWNPDTNKCTSPNICNNYGNVFVRHFVSMKISTPSVMLNRKYLLEHPEIVFPEHMRKAQDTAYFVQLSKFYPLGLVDIPLMKIRLRGNNTNTQAIVRCQVNSRTLDMIQSDTTGFYADVPSTAIFIYKIYALNNRVVQWLIQKGIKRNRVEVCAKILWVLPYLLERMYSKVLIHRYANKNVKSVYYTK